MNKPSNDFKNHLPNNLAMNIASFICNIIISLWLVPYLIHHLGVAAYGLIPLAMILTEYVSLVTQSFNVAITRFLTVEINDKNTGNPTTIFNSSLALLIMLAAIQSVVIIFVLLGLDKIITIPDGMLKDATWLFALTFIGFICSMMSSVFSVSMYSKNRLDLIRINDISRIIIRVLSIVLLFTILQPSLVYVGVGNFLGGASVFVLSMLRWKQLTPELRINFSLIEISQIKPLAAMASWTLINNIGYLLFLRIDTYIVNRFISPEACGEYAAVLQWSQLVRTAAGVFSGVITPLGMIYYSRGEIKTLVRMMGLGVKLMTLLLATPLALLCAFSGDILAYWLGENFRHLDKLMTLQLCTLTINLGVLPLFSINVALNRIKVPALLSILLGGINFILALYFVSNTELGYYGVALAGVIVLTLKNTLFTPFYASHLLQLPTTTFLRPLAGGGTCFFIVFLLCLWLKKFLLIQNLFELAALIAAISIISFLPIILICLDINERSAIVNIAPLKFRRFCKCVLLVRTT